MTIYNKKIIEKLQYLDNILKIIFDSGVSYPIDYKIFSVRLNYIYSKLTFHKICEQLTSKFSNKLKHYTFNDVDSDAEFYPETPTLKSALLYLHSENLIDFNEHEFTASITFKGIVKISGGGFVKEYKNQVLSKNLQNAAWIFSIISFFVGLFLNKLLLYFKQW